MRALSLLFALFLGSFADAAEPLELVLRGGRVMDPESGLDAVRDVGIRDGRVAALSVEPLAGLEVLDVRGLVVAPGFIDLHAHGQDPTSNRFQARDGVTTALDLELGAFPVQAFYDARAGAALLHYGVSVGHIPARIRLKHGFDAVHPATTLELATGLRGAFFRFVRRVWRPTEYAREPADAAEIEALVALVASGLDQGGLGIGFGLDYTPAASAAELRALFELAARRGVPCFVHPRGAAQLDDLAPLTDVLAHAEATGAALHVVHIASSGQGRTAAYLAVLEEARARGLDVTTEVYPYTAGSTYIESAFFDEGWRERLGIDYGDVVWSRPGERLTAESFTRYRRRGGSVILHFMTAEMVDPVVADPTVMIASDGIPLLHGGEHPRGAGTFSRVLGRYVRERSALSLMEALRKMTLLPARRLEQIAPALGRKGRVRVGADADLTVFDPARIIDRATYEDSHRESEGIEYVFVAGTAVVREGALVPDVLPGRPLRAGSGAASSGGR